jgi:activator of HSP90 ATPase
MTSFEMEVVFHVPSFILYHAWITSDGHSKMTGAKAECSSAVGGEFSAWDGYITGQNIELQAGQKIVQSWRTTDFQSNDRDSEVTITFRDHGNHCHLVLKHRNIPNGQPDYQAGWKQYYFEPMIAHFG